MKTQAPHIDASASSPYHTITGPLLSLLLTLVLLFSTACQRSEIPVNVDVDDTVITHMTLAETVRDVLNETNVTLGDLDRVSPDLYRSVSPNMTIKVIRVTEKLETETLVIPYEQNVVVNEALPEGEQRLAQLGVNGAEEIVTKIIYENGVEVSRSEESRRVTQAPVEEVIVVGAQSDLPTGYFDGIITYLSGGNAWIMKETNAARRPLTTSGDLDGRVFSLSPDGSTLLYSRVTTDVIDEPLNELWMVNTRIVGEPPISLPVQGVLYAAWSPVLTDTVIAFSRADRVPSQPGWKANNDLWLWDITTPPEEALEVSAANTRGLYPWWGSNYAWSPDGQYIAFANASQVGVIDVYSRTHSTLLEFAPLETNSEWVWVPTIDWAPNSQFLVTVAHGKSTVGLSDEASQVFDVWLTDLSGQVQAKIWEQAGMWSNPTWHADGITLGRAVNPLRSVNSRYKLTTIDHDGSNPTLTFPLNDEIGLDFPELSWFNDTGSAAMIYQNNLYLLHTDGRPVTQLTADNQSRQPLWRIPATISTTLSMVSASRQLSQTQTISTTETMTSSTTSTETETTTVNPTKTPRNPNRQGGIRENFID